MSAASITSVHKGNGRGGGGVEGRQGFTIQNGDLPETRL